MWLQIIFCHGAMQRIIEMVITKMVALDTSCKHMGWYGYDSF